MTKPSTAASLREERAPSISSVLNPTASTSRRMEAMIADEVIWLRCHRISSASGMTASSPK
jgi:hypothetical protein